MSTILNALVASVTIVSLFCSRTTHSPTHVIPNVLVCKSEMHAWAIQEAFVRGERRGWERLAIELARARSYRSMQSAFDNQVCIFRRELHGDVLAETKSGDHTVVTMKVGFPHESLFGVDKVYLYVICGTSPYPIREFGIPSYGLFFRPPFAK